MGLKLVTSKLFQQCKHCLSIMFDEMWSEIQDMQGEIFDIPEMKEDEEDDAKTFSAFLKSDWDF